MTAQPAENKMGVVPVQKLLITMSLPMMASMLVQALYNIVDSIFVSQISENALAAVSLAFPVQNLMLAIGAGTGVGINALLSRSLGEKNFEEADRAANNGIFLTFLSFLIFLIFGLFFSRIFFMLQTDVDEIISYGYDYLSIITAASLGMFGQMTLERLLQSTGRTFYTMITQGIGAITNIILDPILIFGWFGLPAMGVAGAAVATVIGQFFAMFLALYFNLHKNPEIHLKLRGFRPRLSTIRRIYSVGFPSIMMQAIGSIMTFGMNKILLSFTSTAAAVFGVYFKLQSFIFMPVIGLNNAMVPIMSYNYGAQKRARMTDTFKFSVFYAVGLMLIGLTVFQLIPAQLLRMFNASENLITIGVPALRRISLSYIFAGYCIISLSVFQALGHGMFSLLVSAARQLLILLPVAWLLSRTGNLDLVWLAFPIAELGAVTLSSLFLRKLYLNTIKPMPL